MAYEGSTQLASGIVQRNGNSFPLVHATAVQVGDDEETRLSAVLTSLQTAIAALQGLLPAVSSSDNGKFLSVVSGQYALVSLPNAEGVSF